MCRFFSTQYLNVLYILETVKLNYELTFAETKIPQVWEKKMKYSKGRTLDIHVEWDLMF